MTNQTGELRSADSIALLPTTVLGRGATSSGSINSPPVLLGQLLMLLGKTTSNLWRTLHETVSPHRTRANPNRLLRLLPTWYDTARVLPKWQVNHEVIAFICSCSVSTVRGWFRRGRNYRRPRATDMRYLALMNFILEHYEDIPHELLNLLCPPERNQ